MEPDDDLCLCFHVTLRKVRNYLRTHQLQQASQLSECHGAGTGCGWCRPFLERLFQQHGSAKESADASAGDPLPMPDRSEYARQRACYRQQKEASQADDLPEKPL